MIERFVPLLYKKRDKTIEFMNQNIIKCDIIIEQHIIPTILNLFHVFELYAQKSIKLMNTDSINEIISH